MRAKRSKSQKNTGRTVPLISRGRTGTLNTNLLKEMGRGAPLRRKIEGIINTKFQLVRTSKGRGEMGRS